ncbi:MAG TPA: AMP-binding protein [Candidatus Krumholzibacteria bacterium]|nr:AMP-binding protein [Candidatus Krumholzibacteria bacterium]
MLQQNLVETFATSLRRHWDVACFADLDGGTLTNGDVANRILKLHWIFAECGLERGDRVALVGRNSAHWAVTYLAAVTYGAVIVPILPDFTPAEIEHIVRHSGSSLLFASDTCWDGLSEERMPSLTAVFRLADLGLFWSRTDAVAAAAAHADTGYVERYGAVLSRTGLAFPAVEGSALAAIVYTSGTTGFSKGVMLDHHGLMVNVRYFIDNVDLVPGDTIVSFLPLAHAFGCAFDFLSPFVAGCHVIFVEKIPTPKVLLAAFAKHRPAVVMSVPLIIEKIYRNRVKPQLESPKVQFMLKVPGLRSVVQRKIRDALYEAFGGRYKELVVGGAALNKEVEDFFRQIGFNLTCGYGMTECGPLISYTVQKGRPPVGSVGRVIPYLECRIAEPDPESGIGEVLVRGENRMLGYYNDQDATDACIDADGWLHTGDLGRLDDDGFLYLTGRSKNMILTASGQNIYPEEIESQLNNMPCVAESLVLESKGLLVALVYPDLESVDRACLKGKQVETMMEDNRQALNRRLPGYSQITRLKVMYEEFEKTPTKKIKRRLYSAAS